MTNQPSDLGRIKALFALSKLSITLRSDVLSGGSIAARFDLGMAHTVNLSADIVLRRDELFAAFRQAADVAPVPQLKDGRGSPVEASVSIDADGAGIVTIGTES